MSSYLSATTLLSLAAKNFFKNYLAGNSYIKGNVALANKENFPSGSLL